MLSHWKWLTFYILKCLLYTDDYLLFVHVLYMLFCDDCASCKTACGWWVTLYKYVLIKNKNKMYMNMYMYLYMYMYMYMFNMYKNGTAN